MLADRVFGSAVRLTRDRSTAEDLVHEAALSAFRAFGRLLREHLDTAIVGPALEALPTEGMVATLYLIDDLSYGQIAGVLDCPVGTVRSRRTA